MNAMISYILSFAVILFTQQLKAEESCLKGSEEKAKENVKEFVQKMRLYKSKADVENMTQTYNDLMGSLSQCPLNEAFYKLCSYDCMN